MRLPSERSPCLFLPYTTPLFEEKRHVGGPALIADAQHPLRFHRPCSSAALTTDDDPADSLKIQRAEIFQQWLDGEKANGHGSAAEIVNAW